MRDHQPDPAKILANLRHLYGHLAHGRAGGVQAQQAQAKTLLAPAVELLERLTTPRPRSDWHEDTGNVLWWMLPVCEPPYCGTPLDSSWPFGEGVSVWWTPLVIPGEKTDA